MTDNGHKVRVFVDDILILEKNVKYKNPAGNLEFSLLERLKRKMLRMIDKIYKK